MTRIAIDTVDVGRTADALMDIGGELAEVLARLPGDALTLMPPAVAAQVVEAVADAEAHVAEVAMHLALNAVDLRRRVLLAELSQDEALLASVRGSLAFLRDGAGGIHDSIQTFVFTVKNVRLSTLEDLTRRAPALGGAFRWLEPIERSPGFRIGGRALAVLGAAEHLKMAWDGTDHDPLIGRGYTLLASGVSDAILLHPAVTGANLVTVGAFRADLGALYTMQGKGLSAAQRGFERGVHEHADEWQSGNYLEFGLHVALGTGTGYLDGVNEGLNDWSRDAANGKWGPGVQLISAGENWLIDTTYEPVTRVAANFTNAIGTGVHAVGHGVSVGADAIGDRISDTTQAIDDGVHRLLGSPW
jgi:hypothetical protein